MSKVSVIGAGSWGTALAILLEKNGHEVTLWSHREEEAKELAKSREHKSKLPGVQIPERIEITGNLESALQAKDVLVFAVPSVAVRSTAKKVAPYVKKGQLIVNVAKGIEETTLMTLTDITKKKFPEQRAVCFQDPAMQRR